MQRNKKRVAGLIALIMAIISMTIMPQSLKVKAEETTYFPLPLVGTPYSVTVLNKYSGGGEHGSYINKYVLGNSTDPNDMVADIAVSTGTEVYAVADGEVITSTYSSGGGNYIVVQHYDGTYSYYGHLSSRSVSKGYSVGQGEVIGYSGMTGTATGPHLHFEYGPGRDPYCEYAARGYLTISSNSAASIYPHEHAESNDLIENVEISFSDMRAEGISRDDAKIIGTVNNPGRKLITRVHVILQEGGSGEVWNFSEDCNLTSSSFNMWYYLKDEFRDLLPGTSYSYRFKAEADGVWYSSEYEYFTTEGSPLDESISDYEDSDSAYNAQESSYADVFFSDMRDNDGDKLFCHLNNPSGITIPQVGGELYKDGCMIWTYTEPSGLSKDFNIWYEPCDFGELDSGSYSYRFFADFNGQRYYSDLATFWIE